MTAHIYLVPGFFGFANLGGMAYFGPVARHLVGEAPGVRIHTVQTHPTATLGVRATRLYEAIASTSNGVDEIHLVGHSSGGLDARLLATPGVSLPGVDDPEGIASRIRSVVTVAAPNHGTPSAEFFATVAGKQLLRLLSLATLLILRRGSVPLSAFVTLADLVRRSAERVVPGEPAMVDHVFDELLNELDEDRREEVRAFFAEVHEDRGLLNQIGPDAIELFNSSTGDRPGVRYGSVITRARRPGLGGVLAQGLSASAQSAHAAFVLMYRLASRMPEPLLDPTQRAALLDRWPDLEAEDNDGMVPSFSQPWGEVIRAVDADHLDVLGHYGDPTSDPPRYDWFTTGTGFERDPFEATWTDVAHFCLDEA